MAQNYEPPKWQQELESFAGITSTFILEGNINDLYPLNQNSEIYFDPFNNVLGEIFNDYDLLFGDPLFGFSDPLEREGEAGEAIKNLAETFEKIAKSQRKRRGLFYVERPSESDDQMKRFSEAVRAALTQTREDGIKKPIAAVVNFASRLIRQSEQQDHDEKAMYLNFHYASQNALRLSGKINTLILVVDKRGDVPSWFYANNPKVRTITILNPDKTTREAYIGYCFKELDAHKDIKDRFINMTEGLKLLNIDELQRLYEKKGLPIEKVTETIAMFKYGLRENKWEMLRKDLVEKDIGNELQRRVKGQERAILKIEKIIKRAVTGLSGMQKASGIDKPRGILFLAGPTGTGKTEIVKSVTELLFGDEKACIRFDMSEYSVEQSDQKLFGAPPGYVGYNQGGQLTNAVKANPFSVLLFDEIEKAHPSIMDKFLQILEDGRMTDGQGNTVYFSQTLIFFTSNAGISETVKNPDGTENRILLVKPGEAYEEIEKKVFAALANKFKPEVLNRIGENIVVFDYISQEAAKDILAEKIKGISERVADQNKITINLEDNGIIEYLMEFCMSETIRSYGGRGIDNVVESHLINPLAEYIFNNNMQAGGNISITRTLLEGQLK